MAHVTEQHELVKKGYGGYVGWGETEAMADFQATSGQGKWTGAPKSVTNAGVGASLAEQQRLQKEAIQPTLNVLQQTKPIISQQYEQAGQYLQSQVDPLKQRYEAIISDIKGSEQRELERATTAAAREYGKRGIPLSSGQYEKYLGEEVTQPISQQYAGMLAETGYQRENVLKEMAYQIAQLPLQEQKAIKEIDLQMANLTSESAQRALEYAMQIRQMDIQQSQFEQQEARLREAGEFQKRIYEETTLPESQARIANIGKTTGTQLKFTTIGDITYALNPYTGEVVSKIEGEGSDTDKYEYVKVGDEVHVVEKSSGKTVRVMSETSGGEEENIPWYKKVGEFFNIY